MSDTTVTIPATTESKELSLLARLLFLLEAERLDAADADARSKRRDAWSAAKRTYLARARRLRALIDANDKIELTFKSGISEEE